VDKGALQVKDNSMVKEELVLQVKDNSMVKEAQGHRGKDK
jgi:hypothetical protein